MNWRYDYDVAHLHTPVLHLEVSRVVAHAFQRPLVAIQICVHARRSENDAYLEHETADEENSPGAGPQLKASCLDDAAHKGIGIAAPQPVEYRLAAAVEINHEKSSEQTTVDSFEWCRLTTSSTPAQMCRRLGQSAKEKRRLCCHAAIGAGSDALESVKCESLP